MCEIPMKPAEQTDWFALTILYDTLEPVFSAALRRFTEPSKFLNLFGSRLSGLE